MSLFQVDKKNFIKKNKVVISGDDFSHIKRSLRKKTGDVILMTDGELIYQAKITGIGRTDLSADIVSIRKVDKKNKVNITLYSGIIQFSNFEKILNYSTQFGVTQIYPMITEFTQFRIISDNKVERWKKIITEAARQSFNPEPPKLNKPIQFAQAITKPGTNILLYPYTGKKLKDVLKKKGKINLFTGPEAGFSDKEIEMARENKVEIVRMPYNILRAETAVLAGVCNTIFALE